MKEWLHEERVAHLIIPEITSLVVENPMVMFVRRVEFFIAYTV